jgi:ABC-type Mn2+/Zn2+ transport system permease subunit
MVGGLLTAALVAIPPSAASNLGKNLRQYTLGAALIGGGSAVAGIVLFWLTGLPAGPMTILVNGAVFLATIPFSR